MKVNLIKDENGNLVATFENPKSDKDPIVRPALKPGHTVFEVDVPENYTTDIKSFYEQHSRK
jgi:hypothetical protein